MHECSVVESLVKTLKEYADANGIDRITAVNLVVGELTGYVTDSLSFYFDMLGKGTAAEGAKIEVRFVKPLLLCHNCGKTFERKPFSFACPDCNVTGNPTKSGNECYIESIEYDEVTSLSSEESIVEKPHGL